MYVLKKDGRTKNTFSEEVKHDLVKEGWKVILDTLKSGEKTSGKDGSKDVK